MAELKFVTSIDNSQLEKEAKQTENVLSSIGKEAENIGTVIDRSFESSEDRISRLRAEASNLLGVLADIKARSDADQGFYTPADIRLWIDTSNALKEINAELELEKEKLGQVDTVAESIAESYTESGDALDDFAEKSARLEALYDRFVRRNMDAKQAVEELTKIVEETPFEGIDPRFQESYGGAASRILNEYKEELARTEQEQNKFNQSVEASPLNRGEELTAQIQTQIAVLDDLEDSLKNVEKQLEQLRSVNTGELLFADSKQYVTDNIEKYTQQREELAKEYAAEQNALKVLQADLKRYNTEQRNAGDATLSFRTQLLQARNALGELIIAGKQNTDEYRQAEAELKRLATVQREVTTTTKALTDGFSGGQIQGAVQGIQGLLGAYTAARGIAGLFTKDQEKQDEIQRRLAQSLSILVGIQQVSNTLNATSAFRINTVAKAQQIWTSIQNALTRSTQAATIAARGFAIAITGGLAVAIPILIGLYNRMKSAQEKAREEQERATKAAREQTETYANSVGSSVGSVLANYTRLQREFIALGDNVQKQNKFIKDNQSTFNEWGRSINSVNEAEQLLVKDEAKFKQTIEARARAVAAMTIATDAYATSIKKNIVNSGLEAELESLTSEIASLPQTITQAMGTAGTLVEVGNPMVARLQKQAEQIKAQIDLNTREITEAQEIANKAINENIEQTGIASTLANSLAGTAYNANAQKETKKAYDEAVKLFQDYQKRIADLEKQNIDERNKLRRDSLQTDEERIQFDLDLRLKAIDEERTAFIEMINAVNKARAKIGQEAVGLTATGEVDTSIYDSFEENARNRALQENQNNFDKLLEQNATYQTRRKKIIEDAQSDINKLIEKGYNDEAKVREKQRDKELSSLAQEQLESSELWQQLFQNFAGASTQYLEQLLLDANTAIDSLENLTPEARAALKGQLDALTKDVASRNPFKTMQKAYENYRKAIKSGDTREGLKQFQLFTEAVSAAKSQVGELGGSLSELAGVFDDELASAISSVTSLIEDGIDIFEAFSVVGKISTEDLISGISSAISLVATIIGMLSNTAKLQQVEQARQKATQSYWEAINLQVERYVNLLEKASGIDYTNAQQGALNAAQSGLEYTIKQLQGMNISKAVENVIYKGYSGPLINYANYLKGFIPQIGEIQNIIQSGEIEQYRALQENAALWALIPDNIKDAINAAVDYDEQLKQLQEDFNADIFQTTSKSLEDAIVQGMKGGASAIDDLGNYFEDVMRNALIQAFLINTLRKKVDDFYQRYVDLSADGLTQEERELLRKEYEDLLNLAREESNRINDILGTTPADSREAVAQGIATASQDSIDELNGRFTAIQGHTFQMVQTTNELLTISRTELANQIAMLNHIAAIHINTDRLENIENTLDFIRLNGVRMIS